MTHARAYIVAAMRRVRLEAALALAEQNRAAQVDADRLAAKLAEARIVGELTDR